MKAKQAVAVWIVIVAGFLGVAVLLVGCDGETETVVPREDTAREGRFVVQSPAMPGPDEEEILVTWKGNTSGHTVGATSTFTVSLENVGESERTVRYCLSLLDQEGMVTEVGQRRHTLSGGMGTEDTVSVLFTEELTPGTYGLALVVQDPEGPDAGVVYIEVGAGRGDVIDIPRTAVEEAVDACAPVDAEGGG